MRLYSENKDYKLYEGNMLDMLEVIAPNSIDSIVTDPPYELNFMNKGWDNTGIAFQPSTWLKCLEVLKPGGYLLAFGGSRTFHRIACAIEDAGFEIRDTIMWLYGSGFPKSMNIGLAIDKKNGVESELGDIKPGHEDFVGRKTDGHMKFEGGMIGFDRPWMHDEEKREAYHYKKTPTSQSGKKWDGWGSALKPSYEPIIVARKPFNGTLVDNVLKYGVGGYNIDECRIGEDVIKGGTMPDFRDVGKKQKEVSGQDKLTFGQVEGAERLPLDDHIGRFPANTILTYDDTDFDEVCGGLPETSSQKTNSPLLDIRGNNYNNSHKNLDISYERGYDDSGSAARYFYCAKASKKDREEGLDRFEEKITYQIKEDTPQEIIDDIKRLLNL